MTKKRRLMICVLLTLVVMLLSGCSGLFAKPTSTSTPTPTPISDEDFAELAKGTCEELKSKLTDIKNTRRTFIEEYEMESEAYQQAADKLVEIEIIDEFAPRATNFRTSLIELAEVYNNFAKALIEGLDKSGLAISKTKFFATTVDGKALVFTDKWIDLDIDTDLVLRIVPIKTTFQEAAKVLGLDACAGE